MTSFSRTSISVCR